MSIAARCALVCCLALSGFATLALWQPPALADLGLDPSAVLEDATRLGSEFRRAERLDASRTRILSNARVKNEIADALLDGSLTLLEAGVRLRAMIDEAGPWAWESLRRAEEGADDDERVFRHAVGWLRESGPKYGPGDRAAAADRLEEELNERLCLGTLVLPPR